MGRFSLVWRNRIGEEGVEWLLTETIRAGQRAGTVQDGHLKKVTVDTTVMEKNIAHPTDARLYERARRKLVGLAREAGIGLRQNYNRLGPRLSGQVGRYAHARQFKRMHKALRRLKGYTGHAYSFQLLVTFAAERLNKRPCLLQIEDIDVPTILAFLEHIEQARGNKSRSRNARLAAVKSFFRYLEHRVPAVLDQALRVHAIPMKKIDQGLVASLSRTEVQTLLDAPDRRTASGIRDRAMLHLAFAGGLRVSELVGVGLDQFEGRSPASIHIIGKGRRERVLPLWKETAAAMRAWIAIRPEVGDTALFLNNAGRMMTRSGFEYILKKHAAAAASITPSLATKSITPHVLRHSCAMHMLQATRDIRKVALWLGHATLQSTEIYLRADPTEKLEMLDALEPLGIKPGKFRPPDKLLAMLAAR